MPHQDFRPGHQNGFGRIQRIGRLLDRSDQHVLDFRFRILEALLDAGHGGGELVVVARMNWKLKSRNADLDNSDVDRRRPAAESFSAGLKMVGKRCSSLVLAVKLYLALAILP